MELQWNSSLTASNNEVNPQILVIKGTLLDNSVNKNGWQISEEDLPRLASQVAGLQLRCDHGRSIRDVIGGMTSATYDSETKKVMFEAEVDDPSVIRSITRGRLKNVSIGAQAQSICSICKTPNRPVKTCKCEGGHSIIKDFKLKEVSIITEPAYPEASEFSPVTFAASVEKELEFDDKKLINEETKVEQTLEENKIMEEKNVSEVKTAETTNIVATVDPTLVEAITNLVKKNSEYLDFLAKEKEEKEKEMKEKSESKMKEENEKTEAFKLEEKVKAIIKEELSKMEKKPAEEMKEEKKETEEEEEETEKEECDKSMKTAGAKVETNEVVTASSTSTNMVEAMWSDVKKAAKDLRIL